MKNKKEEVISFQNIILHLKDGRTVQATVPSFCEDEEELAGLHISRIEMTKPRPLPDGSNFQLIGE